MPELLWKNFQCENSVKFPDLNYKSVTYIVYTDIFWKNLFLLQFSVILLKVLVLRTQKNLEISLLRYSRSVFLTDFKIRPGNPSAKTFL